MTKKESYFKGKKITVMGLGLLGRGIGVIKFLAEQGAVLMVTDLKTKEQLAPALKQLSKYKNITYVLGEHRLEDFNNKDLIIRAPNAPLDSIYLKEAKKNNIEIDQDASLFCKLAPAGVKIIGVTGTRGKSTVTHLLYEILKAAKKNVYLAGNVRGTATLPLLKKVRSGDCIVMELDSWQLQSFNTFSPNLAIFTTFMNDHQNYYGSTSLTTSRGGMERYFADKANIFTHQTKDDVLIAGSQVVKMVKAQKPKGKLIIPKQSLLAGKHREYNAALASTAAKELGIKDSVIKKAVKNFRGLPGRLEFIKDVKGVKYYNDTTATTPDAVMAAVHALKDYKGRIVLIGGGTDKELDFKRYSQIVPKYLKELILFKGTATDKILKVLPLKFKKQVVLVENMTDAFKCATSLAEKGDLILLSPGAASFGIFKNEFDRGDQFVRLVKKMK
ncbi:MAG: UDP-N-acetylmuramoyl-L-alanine--D-glutamate ligase [Candidatus Pacebacteria bacterium]|nr:UDP-N-acetylmuramoyl-L-alanine--D-glutamate ligase [Candidatus Paceibacterota bacterium]